MWNYWNTCHYVHVYCTYAYYNGCFSRSVYVISFWLNLRSITCFWRVCVCVTCDAPIHVCFSQGKRSTTSYKPVMYQIRANNGRLTRRIVQVQYVFIIVSIVIWHSSLPPFRCLLSPDNWTHASSMFACCFGSDQSTCTCIYVHANYTTYMFLHVIS